MRRHIITALGAITLMAGLSGCVGASQTQASYADLGGEQTAADQLPVGSLGDGSDGFDIDQDSTRRVGAQGDTEIFLAAATEQGHDRICLIIVAADGPYRSCGQVGFGMSDSLNEYRILPDADAETALDPDAGWSRLSDNVFTRPVPEDTRDPQ